MSKGFEPSTETLHVMKGHRSIEQLMFQLLYLLYFSYFGTSSYVESLGGCWTTSRWTYYASTGMFKLWSCRSLFSSYVWSQFLWITRTTRSSLSIRITYDESTWTYLSSSSWSPSTSIWFRCSSWMLWTSSRPHLYSRPTGILVLLNDLPALACLLMDHLK